jgi:2,3-bisphosphoglycerate-independent phosphoglycerate mutase
MKGNMPFLLIVLDGLGDHAYSELRGRTPLEAARQSSIAKFKAKGAQGLMDPIFPGVPPSSDTSHLTIFGYDLKTEYFGRGPIEASGEGVELKEGEIAFRANMATVELREDKATVIDRRAGRISSQETSELARILNEAIQEIDGSTFKLVPLAEHRLAMIISGQGLSYQVTDNDPHADGRPLLKCQPLEEAENVKGASKLADLVNKYEIKAIGALREAEVNLRRRKSGLPQANAILVRGAGVAKRLTTFEQKHGMSACAIAGGALYKGVAKAVGMKLIEVPGANGMPNTNLKGKVEASTKALDKYDFVFMHVKATDNFSHKGDPIGKSGFISLFDDSLSYLIEAGSRSATVMITGDHTTPCDRGMHTGEPVPVLLSGPSIRIDETKLFSEREAATGSLGRISGASVVQIAQDSTERTVELGTRPSPKALSYLPKDLVPLKMTDFR